MTRAALTRVVLLLSGMRDNSCRERLERVIGRIAGVKDVSVSLIRARAVVVCRPPCGATQIVGAVKAIGYGATVEHN